MPSVVRAKRILITSAFGYQNRGDWQLTHSMLRVLEEAFPGCQIDVLCRNPKTQAAWFPQVTFHRMLGVSFRPPGPVRFLESAIGFAFGLVRTALSIRTGIGNAPLSRQYREADIVVAAAGGYLMDTNVSILMHAAHIWLGVLAGKPVMLAPQSLGPLSTWRWRALMRRLLARIDVVCVRDEPSRALAVKLMGPDGGRLRLVPDVAFQDESTDLDAAKGELIRLGLWSRPFVALTVSNGGMSNYAGPPKVEGLLACLGRLCERLQHDGFQVLVWTHVESDAGTAGDETAMREFAGMAPPNVVISYERYCPRVVRGILHYSIGVVSQRMHPCIFAIQAGRPVVAMATGPKFLGVLSMLQLESAVLDAAGAGPDALYARLKEAVSQPRRFLEAREKARRLGERSHALFREALLECAGTSPRLPAQP